MFVRPDITHPELGDFAVCTVAGGAGLADAVGEFLDGDPFREALAWLRRQNEEMEPLPPWKYGHALVYVGNMQIVQAEPQGARIVDIENWDAGHKYILWSTGAIALTQQQRTAVWSAARGCAYRHVPYSIADYFALTAHRLHIPAPGLKDFIEDSGHMICSQLVDWCYQQAGVKLFNDDRWNGYVTPADEAALLIGKMNALLAHPVNTPERRRRWDSSPLDDPA